MDEIIEKGPLNVAKSKITPGMIIEKIDGAVIGAGADWCPLLNRKAGRPVLLSVFDPAKNARFDETVKPISIHEEEELLYERWVKSRRELTDKLSGGRIGYVHVRGMNDASYRETFSEILGRNSGKQAHRGRYAFQRRRQSPRRTGHVAQRATNICSSSRAAGWSVRNPRTSGTNARWS